jgi:integrase
VVGGNVLLGIGDQFPIVAAADDDAALALNDLGDLVFAHPLTGGPLPKANVTRRMRAALKAATLDSSHRFHDLRHTFGTRMAAAGVPMRTVAGVDGPQGSGHDADLCRLRAEPH